MIPDFLPVLRKGPGATPEDGGCLMQVAGFLKDGKSWTETPKCVHPVLGTLAISVNDQVSDTARPRLALLIPDLLDTNSDDPVLTVRLAIWCAKQVLPIWQGAFPAYDRPAAAIAAAEAWCECPCAAHADAATDTALAAYVADIAYFEATRSAAYASHYAAFAAAAHTARSAARYACAAAEAAWDARAGEGVGSTETDTALYDLLAGAITEHRRLTGHEPVAIDPARWAEVCELLGVAS